MVGAVLFCVMLAVQDPGSPPPPAAGDAKAEANAGGDAARARYNELREKTPENAAAQWKLALWCEQNGLPVEAATHFASVVEHDPKREAAWRKLGFKKHDGRWMTDEQIAADEEQKKADKVWAPLLKKWHKALHGGKGQAEAEAEIAKITDPKAVASVYREFGGGGPIDQAIAIQILGQIDSPVASKVLAVLAIYGKTPEIRRRATETLRGRKAEEFLDLLVGLLNDPIKYEVKPVGGPGSPGVLLVEGKRANMQRFYAAPPPPDITFRPGDMLSYDAFGMPVISRPIGPAFAKAGVPGSKSLVSENREAIQFSATQELLEAQRGALAAQAQLAGDVAQIEAINNDRIRFNDLVIAVAKDATGKDISKTPQKPLDPLVAAANNKYQKKPARTAPKPTINELVPLAYRPAFAQVSFVTQIVVDT